MRSFKSNEKIHKKEGGSYYVVSANKASSLAACYRQQCLVGGEWKQSLKSAAPTSFSERKDGFWRFLGVLQWLFPKCLIFIEGGQGPFKCWGPFQVLWLKYIITVHAWFSKRCSKMMYVLINFIMQLLCLNYCNSCLILTLFLFGIICLRRLNCTKILFWYTLFFVKILKIWTPEKMAVIYMIHVMRKPVLAICEQQRRRSACASAQSVQHLCFRYLDSIIPLVSISKISRL